VEVEVDENGKEIPVSKKNNTSKEQSENTAKETTSEGSEQPAKEVQSEAVEGFNEYIVEHFSDSDYNFIITTALFILFLFCHIDMLTYRLLVNGLSSSPINS
jgi:hypothetical protein